MKKILTISGDPGGAAAVAPVLLKLAAEPDVHLENLAYFRSPEVFDRRGVPYHEIPNEFTEARIAEVFDRSQPNLLLCGTSMNDWGLEGDFLAEAAEREIPSVAVLDFWSNYRARFCSTKRSEPTMPTRIAVMDEQARTEMIAEGFASDRLVATGQPAFDDLALWRSGATLERREIWRRDLDVSADELFVVFVSQPVFANSDVNGSVARSRGYDEHSVAALLLQALETVADESSRRITLLVRPHPREDAAKYHYLRSERIRVSVTNATPARETIVASDLVVGINSVLLVEACYLGCLVVSLQPNLSGPDPLPTNRLGFSRAVYSGQEILPVLREMLLDEGSRRRASERLAQFFPAGGAAQRITELVRTLLF